MGLKSNAYASTMQGVAGAINSSKTLVYSACTIRTDCDETAAVGTAAVETGNGLGNSLIVLGQSITLAYGYPRHTGAGIARVTNIADISDGVSLF
jgi:MSHA pilin protein MshA|tara:strand:- start:83304 stop:83588 length:285 start_codon:yes stop_codon:yes gene_type:complete